MNKDIKKIGFHLEPSQQTFFSTDYIISYTGRLDITKIRHIIKKCLYCGSDIVNLIEFIEDNKGACKSVLKDDIEIIAIEYLKDYDFPTDIKDFISIAEVITYV